MIGRICCGCGFMRRLYLPVKSHPQFLSLNPLHDKQERPFTNTCFPKTGQKESTTSSAQQIRAFIDFYHIDMTQFTPSSPSDYPTFTSFFTRHHAPGARPIQLPSDPSKATVPSDCRIVVYPSISLAQKLWIKGANFSIAALILDAEKAKVWDEGAVASCRLSPQDYHRYHSPVEGTVKWFKRVGGDYYQVDPVCLGSRVDVLTRNARSCLGIQTREFGMVLFAAIGATEVGSVEYVFFFFVEQPLPLKANHEMNFGGRFLSVLLTFIAGSTRNCKRKAL